MSGFKLGGGLLLAFALGVVVAQYEILLSASGIGTSGDSGEGTFLASGAPRDTRAMLAVEEERLRDVTAALKESLRREDELRERLEGVGLPSLGSGADQSARRRAADLVPEAVPHQTTGTKQPPPSKLPLPLVPPGGPSLEPHETPAEPTEWKPRPGTAADKLRLALEKYPRVREPLNAVSGRTADGMPGKRPSWERRKFASPVIEYVVRELTTRMKDESLAMLFANCFPNTLDTTVYSFSSSAPDAFVITGDIPAQWLRDSTNQVLPYIPFAGDDPRLGRLLCGLVRRQGRDVNHDPYANAFVFGTTGGGHATDKRKPAMTPHVFEGKYELDSLCALLKLSHRYWKHTGDLECFDDGSWRRAVSLAMDTIEEQMKGTDEEGDRPAYTFFRHARALPFDGRGAPGRRTGMSKCGFRPSDDSITYPFLVPANAMAVVELRHAAEILERMGDAEAVRMAQRARAMADVIDEGIRKHGTVIDPMGRPRLAYEVDGMGHVNSMDDANIPSLLSLPYLGYAPRDNLVYVATREFVLSKRNKWYMEGYGGHPGGTKLEGVGGPHIGPGAVWPMSMVIRGLTSTDEDEIRRVLGQIKASSALRGLLNESVRVGNAKQFTRGWFAWVNTLFGELVLELAVERPELLF